MSRPNFDFPSRSQSFERSRRYIQSVSDIYGKDEMEELLDEIRHLEPCSFRSGEIQDFEIDGSRHFQQTGDSAVSVSVQSWDSHAVYRAKMEQLNSPIQVIQSILVNCRPAQCLEKLELFRLAFLVSNLRYITLAIYYQLIIVFFRSSSRLVVLEVLLACIWANGCTCHHP